MTQIDLSKMTNEWIKRAIIGNVQELESIITPMNDEEERQNSAEIDKLDAWIEELSAELERRKSSYKGVECGNCGTRFDNLSTSWPYCHNCGWTQYVYILQWTPFPGRWEHLPEWQLQKAEWELKIGKRHYYEHAIRTNKGFLYPVEIALRIIDYWSKRRDWAKYQTSSPTKRLQPTAPPPQTTIRQRAAAEPQALYCLPRKRKENKNGRPKRYPN